MADFIAVIRRAVDGLTENTPEMRVKVYERARGAVQRQLENMKPRPPEAMLQRQLEKLDAAIREVEAEHAEALPDEAAVAEEAAPEPHYEEPAAPAEEPVAAAEEHAVEAAAEPVEEVAHEEHPVYEEPVTAEPAYEEPQAVYHDEPVHAVEPDVHAEPEVHAEHDVHAEPEVHVEPEVHAESEIHAEPAPWQQPVEDAPTEAWQAPHHEEPAEPEYHAAEPAVYEEPVVEPEPVEAVEPVRASEYNPANRLVEPFASFEKPQEFVEQTQEEPLQSEAAARFDPVWNEPAAETPADPPKDADTVWADQELHNFSGLAPAASADAGARAFEEALSGLQTAPEAAKMPAANEGFSWEAAAFDDLPPIDAPKKADNAQARADDSDLFSEVHGNKPQQPAPDVPGSEWKEAEALRGYGRRGSVANDDDDTAPVADIDQIVAAKLQNKNFRMEPKRRRFGLGRIIGIVLVLAVLGGAGYAAWMNRDQLNAMVNGLISSAPKTAETTAPAASTTPSATTPPASGTAAPAANGSSAAPAADANKQVAALDDGASVTNKFNQRLMADGTETDAGPATAAATPTAEGKSVAQQSIASSAPAQAPAQPAAQTDPAAAQPPAAGDAAAAQPQVTAPVGASEKMFLYEERIGQSSPTAIQGSVVWSVQHEKDASGKDVATVQGNVTVPERNLSALVTFKRNSDPSLPASHLVEIVFSVPPNFEGGKIDSVQRISMKRTEQDRGDALIAVPAKITDDFHMIALNDYPDARKSNLDLLATRDWIDIPITYRNGRRALITMQKGSTGAQAFTTAIRDWGTLGDVSTSQ
ncbi:hypothetical protein [Rhizobium sp. BG4]|uniref:hypothetical protein n=1 Tax=Rhizobium sp. BG4 TaxID=2613770 RepID=UPI00193E3406|nr:hypothetical protein [Rhizobium sp. BG4]QRM44456.1 hypothetical protein F2982_13990 [Rhizobium sp. BG4]